MSLALGYAATGLLIVGTGLAVMRHTTRRVTAREAADLARLHAPLAPARRDLTDGPWSYGSPYLHYVGRDIATHGSDETAPATGYIGAHREPSTIGERAQARHFPSITQEFHRIVGAEFAVEIGASA